MGILALVSLRTLGPAKFNEIPSHTFQLAKVVSFGKSQVAGKFEDSPGMGKFTDIPSQDKLHAILGRTAITTTTPTTIIYYSC